MRLLTILLILLGFFTAHAQPSLTDATAGLAKSMGEMVGPKATYLQSIETDVTIPYVLEFQRTTTNAKGKSSEEKWRFNLADIDLQSVKIEDSKDALRVKLKVKKGLKYIQYSKGEKLSSYTDNLSIFGEGIDNAREIEAHLLNAIREAKPVWEKIADLEGKSQSELMEQLLSLVDDMSLNGTDYRQRMKQMDDFSDRLNLNVVASTSKGSKQNTFIWSLGDLKPSAVRLRISGSNAMVEAVTKENLAWVYVEKDGVQKDYAKQVAIRVPDPDKGKLLVDVLEKLIPFGEKAIQNRLPIPGKANENFNRIAENLGSFRTEKGSVEVSMERNCQSLISQVLGDTRREYAFHWGDIDPNSVALKMDDERVEIHLQAENRSKYIWVSKDGAQQNYDDGLSFRVADVEKGRLVAHLLPSLIDQCPEEVVFGEFADVQRWTEEGKHPETDISQILEIQSEEEACKWKYAIKDNDEKKPSEASYEFNAYDLDPDQVRVVVNKKKVSVQVQTLKKQNIISSMVKEKAGYVSTLQFEVADIIAAKSMRMTLEQLIANCK